jgi:tripartite-type tricarboxylate transporter receptor subunit TctC
VERRSILRPLVGLPLLAPALAPGQTAWPNRNLTIIVPFPPGGQADTAARPVAVALERALGQPVVVENRPGAGGALGNAAVARAEPDGHTLLMTLPSLAVLPEADRLFDRRPAYEVEQLEPIARILADPLVLVVQAAAPWRSLEEFVADARRRPEALAYASSGIYGVSHIATEMLAAAAGIRLLHVPFNGGAPALTAVVGGQVAMTGVAAGTARRHVEAGGLRILASWGDVRIPALPEVPTFHESGYPEVVLLVWAGAFAPLHVPRDRIERIRQAMSGAMNSQETLTVFERAGSVPAYLDGPEFARFIAQDSARLVAATRRIGRVE